jgi:hypothetical protein
MISPLEDGNELFNACMSYIEKNNFRCKHPVIGMGYTNITALIPCSSKNFNMFTKEKMQKRKEF